MTGTFRSIRDVAPDAWRRCLSTVPPDTAWGPGTAAALDSLPGGSDSFWGIPFDLAEPEVAARWAWLAAGSGPLEVPFGTEVKATFVVLAHFTMPAPHSRDARVGQSSGLVGRVGERVAAYSLVYADGTVHTAAIHRRWEINDVLVAWGQLPFAARPHRAPHPVEWGGPHAPGRWGLDQTIAALPEYWGVGPGYRTIGSYWLYALGNPWPERPLAGLRFEQFGDVTLAIAAVTLANCVAHPLRYDGLTTLRLTGFERPAEPAASVPFLVSPGFVGRSYSLNPVVPTAWLKETGGLGESPDRATDLAVEVIANESSTLILPTHLVPMADLRTNGGLDLGSFGGRIEVLPEPSIPVIVTVVDERGRPTPTRVHFRSVEGRYLPPRGHRREVNDGWFEDLGPDARLGGATFAYESGRFAIELPQGQVALEVSKGFDYVPLRRVVEVTPTTRRLELALTPVADRPRERWMTADTHVHFLPPKTAALEAAAEGLDLVNLLAAQWGDLVTNALDVGSEVSTGAGAAAVAVGSENRHHVLGHVSLLGTQALVFPLSSGGPDESYFGDESVGVVEWAREGRRHGSMVVIPHFPHPYAGSVAALVLGLVDAFEIRDFWTGVDSFGVQEWYRLLNLGYRVPVVGGTDKMSAAMPVGGVRTYARIGDEPAGFRAFAAAVRAGRTYSSSGPLIAFSVDGAEPGDEVAAGRADATVEVTAEARCPQGLSSLQIVKDGSVIAAEEVAIPRAVLTISCRTPVSSGGWLAARCSSPHIAWHRWPVHLAAHTSPVYFKGSPAGVDPTDVAEILSVLDGALLWLRTFEPGSRATQAPSPYRAIARARAVFARRFAAVGRAAQRPSGRGRRNEWSS